MRHFIKILFLVALLRCTDASCQDINFSQFYELPMLRNPALAGIFTGDVRVTAAYRNQWQSVTTPYKTIALGGEMKFPLSESSDDFLTLGMQITHDVAGDSRLSKSQLFPALNFHKSVGDNSYISAGIMGGYVQHRFDQTKLQFDDQFVNGTYSSSNPSRQTFDKTGLSYWDVATGLSFSTVLENEMKFFVGAGLFHFTNPTVAFITSNDIKLKQKFVVNLGASIPASESDKLLFYADYFKQGGNNQLQGGAMYSKSLAADEDENAKFITGGLMYRLDDALIPVVKLDLNRFGIGVSYDINISKLSVASHARGGTELTLVYKDFLNSRNSVLNRSKCPEF